MTDVAVAPDQSLLAVGDEDGQIRVWSLLKGELVANLKSDRNQITCLRFGRDPVRLKGPRPPEGGWLLAAGDRGGGVVVWDLARRIPRSICRGPAGSPEVLVLAFSPDGMTLASTGRSFVQLWDIATGRFLLSVEAGNYSLALAFSPDGKHLAVGSAAAFGQPDAVDVWELEPGRGIDTLRGLLAAVERSTISPDGRLIAALSNDWRIGVWDRAARRLLQILEVTPGFHPDNSALAFSPDGRRLAFSAGEEATLWDLAAGEVVKTWKLFPGLCDRMAFTRPDRLLLFRSETESGELGPFGTVNPAQHPRVCRVRDLLAKEPLKPLAAIRDCNLHVFGTLCSEDGRYYVLEGLGGSHGNVSRIANLYEGETGKKIGTLPDRKPAGSSIAQFFFDPTSKVLSYAHTADWFRMVTLELPSRALIREFDRGPLAFASGASKWVTHLGGAPGGSHTFSLFERDREEPVVTFVLDTGAIAGVGLPRFSPDGPHLFWGNPSGDVTVVDLVEVQRRLAELGLGW